MKDNRDKIGKEIIDSVDKLPHEVWLLSPRLGKTRLGIEVIKKFKCKSVLWVTSSAKLRDIDIQEEFVKWKAKTYLSKTTVIHYNTLSKTTGQFDLIILDEFQAITEDNTVNFFNGSLNSTPILAMSGTMPKHEEKLEILRDLKLKVTKEISIDDAVEQDLVADYNIKVVEIPMEAFKKTISAGRKGNKFMTTEASNYKYLSRNIDNSKLPFKFKLDLDNKYLIVEDQTFELKKFTPKFDADIAYIIKEPNSVFGSLGYVAKKSNIIYGKIKYKGIYYKIKEDGIHYIVTKEQLLNRMRAIYNSPSKFNVAKQLIDNLDGRKIVFTGSIKQAEAISPYTYHSQTDDTHLNQFLNEEIDLLSLVNSGGTGFTYKNVQHFILVKVDSDKSGGTTQKLARSILKQEGYKASIWILCLMGTQDEKWVTSALSNLNQNKIEYINVKNLKL